MRFSKRLNDAFGDMEKGVPRTLTNRFDHHVQQLRRAFGHPSDDRITITDVVVLVMTLEPQTLEEEVEELERRHRRLGPLLRRGRGRATTRLGKNARCTP